MVFRSFFIICCRHHVVVSSNITTFVGQCVCTTSFSKKKMFSKCLFARQYLNMDLHITIDLFLSPHLLYHMDWKLILNIIMYMRMNISMDNV